LTEQPGPNFIVMRTFRKEARISVCETSSVREAFSFEHSLPVLARVKVVLSVESSTLTPAAGRQASQLRDGKEKSTLGVDRPDLISVGSAGARLEGLRGAW
jgi:hypothetical protein